MSFWSFEKRTLADTWESQGVCLDFQQNPLKNPAKRGIIFVTHGPSPWDPKLVVREKWFGRYGNDFWWKDDPEGFPWFIYLFGMHEPMENLVPPCAWYLHTISYQLSLSIKAVIHCIEQPTHSFDFPRRNLPFVVKYKRPFWVIYAKVCTHQISLSPIKSSSPDYLGRQCPSKATWT